MVTVEFSLRRIGRRNNKDDDLTSTLPIVPLKSLLVPSTVG